MSEFQHFAERSMRIPLPQEVKDAWDARDRMGLEEHIKRIAVDKAMAAFTAAGSALDHALAELDNTQARLRALDKMVRAMCRIAEEESKAKL